MSPVGTATSANWRRTVPSATGRSRNTCGSGRKPCARWTAARTSSWPPWGTRCGTPWPPLWHTVRLLESREPTDPALEQIRDISKRQVQHLARLADDLLDI